MYSFFEGFWAKWLAEAAASQSLEVGVADSIVGLVLDANSQEDLPYRLSIIC